jgi:hypothetical protein
MAQPGVVCALTGSSTIPHLEENVGASGWTLTPKDVQRLNMLLCKETLRLKKEQKKSLRVILNSEMNPETAFTDLVYVFETLVENGWAEEQVIMPLFQQFYAMRGKGELSIQKKMKSIQVELREQFFLTCPSISLPPMTRQ